VFARTAATRAWTKRRKDLDPLSDVAEVLSDVDQQIVELQHRVNALLEQQSSTLHGSTDDANPAPG
jgi:hypothetical protein